MGSILSAIRDDEEEYYELCKRFGENPNGKVYGLHRDALKARARAEYEAERAKFAHMSSPTPDNPNFIYLVNRLKSLRDQATDPVVKATFDMAIAEAEKAFILPRL